MLVPAVAEGFQCLHKARGVLGKPVALPVIDG